VVADRVALPRSSQLEAVVELVRRKPNTRQAMLTMYDAGDLAGALVGDPKDVPCTSCIQFILRDGRLHASTYMRSNDVWLGLPYDLFCFSSIQRIVAAEVGAEPGDYHHSVGAMHVYERDAGVQDVGRGPDDPLTAEAPLLVGATPTLAQARQLGHAWLRMTRDPSPDGLRPPSVAGAGWGNDLIATCWARLRNREERGRFPLSENLAKFVQSKQLRHLLEVRLADR
jgi:thymidylate synthase